jgi:hypothetical protein
MKEPFPFPSLSARYTGSRRCYPLSKGAMLCASASFCPMTELPELISGGGWLVQVACGPNNQ